MSRHVCAQVFLVSLALVACGDPQASPRYPGESLLTVKGSLVVADGVELDKGVAPVLTWYVRPLGDRYFSSVRVQDVAVSGEFPGNFELSVHMPPPEDVLASSVVVRGFEDEPRLLIGYIGALPREHEPEVVIGFDTGSGDCGFAEEGGGEETTSCSTEYCDYYGQCFTQTRTCDSEGVCEEVMTSGSDKLRYGLGVLNGFVDDAAIIYLDRPAPAGSYTAWRLGVESLDAGFHLIRFDTDRQEGPSDGFACITEAASAGNERFRAAYADRIAELEDALIGDDELGGDSVVEIVDQWQNYELYVAQSTYEEAAIMEACEGGSSLHVTVADASERITMTFDDELMLGR